MNRKAGEMPAGLRSASAWRVLDAFVWFAGIGVGVWRAAEGTRASVLAAIFALFSVFRFVSAISLTGLSEISATDSRWRVRAAGRLWVSSTAVTGLLFVSLSVAALVLFPRGLGVVMGVIGLLVGQGFLIAGVGLIRDWRRAAGVSPTQVKHEDPS